jgi:hypothetical protein
MPCRYQTAVLLTALLWTPGCTDQTSPADSAPPASDVRDSAPPPDRQRDAGGPDTTDAPRPDAGPPACPHALTEAASCPKGCQWVTCCDGPPFWCAQPCNAATPCPADWRQLTCGPRAFCVPRCRYHYDCPRYTGCIRPSDGGGEAILPGDGGLVSEAGTWTGICAI